MSKANEPIFPQTNWGNQQEQMYGLTKRELFAAMAPNPTGQEVADEMERNLRLNPHNDGPPRPRLKQRHEIIVFLKVKHADALLAELEKEGGK